MRTFLFSPTKENFSFNCKKGVQNANFLPIQMRDESAGYINAIRMLLPHYIAVERSWWKTAVTAANDYTCLRNGREERRSRSGKIIRKAGEVFPHLRKSDHDPLRVSTARTKRHACNRTSHATGSQDCVKRSNRKALRLPVTYRPIFPLTTSRKWLGGLFLRRTKSSTLYHFGIFDMILTHHMRFVKLYK